MRRTGGAQGLQTFIVQSDETGKVDRVTPGEMTLAWGKEVGVEGGFMTLCLV